MRQINDNIIPSQAAGTITSPAIPALNLLYMSAQVTGSGGMAGVLKFQASNDYIQTGSGTPSNWSDIPNATVTSAADGAFLIPKTDCCYEWVRLVYTNSGTGLISVVFKAIGE